MTPTKHGRERKSELFTRQQRGASSCVLVGPVYLRAALNFCGAGHQELSCSAELERETPERGRIYCPCSESLSRWIPQLATR